MGWGLGARLEHVHAGWASQPSKDPSLLASPRSEIPDKLEGELARGEVNTGPSYESSALLEACGSEGKGGQGGGGKQPVAADSPRDAEGWTGLPWEGRVVQKSRLSCKWGGKRSAPERDPGGSGGVGKAL